MSRGPIAVREDGIELAVRATARAGSTCIAGTADDAAGDAWLAVNVAAPPDAGRASDPAARADRAAALAARRDGH